MLMNNVLSELIDPIEEIVESIVIAAALEGTEIKAAYTYHGNYVSWSLYCNHALFMRIETNTYGFPVDLSVFKHFEDDSFGKRTRRYGYNNNNGYEYNFEITVEDIMKIASIALEYV